MTAQQTEELVGTPTGPDDPVPVVGSTRSSARAYRRRADRQLPAGSRLTRTGLPVAAALRRVPYVAVIMLLLTGCIVGVLWLNTLSDAAGLRATQSRIDQMALATQVQGLQREINLLKDPARLAAEAQSLGMVAPGTPAILEVGADGRGTVLGTPVPVPGQAAGSTPVAAAVAPTSSPAATTAPATTPASTTGPATTAPVTAAARTATTTAPGSAPKNTASTAPAAKVPAGKAPAAKSAAAKSTPAKSTPAKPASAKSTPAKSTSAKSTPAASTAAKSTAATSTAAKPSAPTATTGARR